MSLFTNDNNLNMANPLKFSIIIPYRVIDHHVRHCIETCRNLQAPDFSFEIILLPDEITSEHTLPQDNLLVHATGAVYPSTKRNCGAKLSHADYCAFIDSDAYPKPDWLFNAHALLEQHPSIGCVGGPNHIPPESPFFQRVGTRILYCKLGVGAFPSTRLYDHILEVKEVASSNLIVRRTLLNELGGMDTSLLTAEDARLCFQIRNAGCTVAYAPNVEVYHHRRNFPWPYLRSIYRYGHDKAWLLKVLFSPDKYYYFVPMLFVLGIVIGGFAAYLLPFLRWPYGSVLALYAAAVVCQAACFRNPAEMLTGLVGIPATHVAYGIGFMVGLVTPKGK